MLDGKIKINKNILSDGLNLPLMLYLLTGSEWQPIIFFQNLLPPIFLEKKRSNHLIYSAIATWYNCTLVVVYNSRYNLKYTFQIGLHVSVHIRDMTKISDDGSIITFQLCAL